MLPPASFTFAPVDLDLVDALRRELACTETLAWVLARRGITPEAARELLEEDPAAEAAGLHDPMLLGDMAAAVERVRYAIDAGERIVVHGDYDADGVCSTTLLVEGLEELGADVVAFLPDRLVHGYGLGIETVERFAQDGARLVIAVDCGITAVAAVQQANDLGMDVVVCDHHQPGPELPAAILCSTRPSDYPFPELCATAVAGKLLLALGGPSGPRQHELEAIATVADCMPLVGENRILVRRGLRALRTTTRPGLRALADQCGVRAHDIDAETVGFKLAPRLNAVGRVSRSERAYELLRADTELAPRLAAEVDATNDERRAIEREICDAAVLQVEEWSDAEREARIYVVHGRGWHPGVVGIVAARLVSRYCRPVVVVADGDPASASGRSVDGVDLHAAIGSCDDMLLRWGGHSQAAGLTLDPTRVPELRARLAAWAVEHVRDEHLAPRDHIDAVVPGADLRFELVQELERLAPFGMGWPRPRLLATEVQVEGMSGVGGDGSHLRCTLHVGDQRVSAIGFGMAPLIGDLQGERVDVALRPSINRFRGVESLQAELDRCYPIGDVPDCSTIPGWCSEPCAQHDGERVTMDHVLAAATGLVPPDVAAADPDALPALEPLLARAGAVDLRHRGMGIEVVAQLLAAHATVLVVVADVPRRLERLQPLLATGRFGVEAAVLASEQHTPQGIRGRMRRVADAPVTDGATLVVADHASVEHVMAAALAFDAVVVLDPPTTASARDHLAAAPAPTRMYLAFGAREQRFSADAVRAAHDVRATLADLWRHLRDVGPLAGRELERVAFGRGPHRHAPSAVVHGLRTLLGRGLVEVDARDRVRLPDAAGAPAARPAASTPPPASPVR
ncbi:MAG: single-stranded-DNA-specific exonuclease RecJ [Thermoleophilia bacterium]|nr:single-stranded-DNA-specific exonuclease RecJ [Thermoleophilia bacterium]